MIHEHRHTMAHFSTWFVLRPDVPTGRDLLERIRTGHRALDVTAPEFLHPLSETEPCSSPQRSFIPRVARRAPGREIG